MGVRLLQTYIEKFVKRGTHEIDIQREIEEYKRTHNGEDPLILIDLLSTHQLMYTNNHELMLGGRYNLYNKRATELFRKFKSFGVKLVFFTDGPTRIEKIPTCLMRRKNNYEKAIQALEVVYSGVDLSTSLDQLEVQHPVPFFATLKELASNFGEVHISVLNECDAELADFANRNNAFAIISNDTDYLIYEGNWRYWSSRKLNIHSLKTIEFDREALRMTLNLKSEQMALFATMSGNDVIQYDSVRDFHRRIKQGSNHRNRYRSQNEKQNNLHFRAVADQIHKLKLNPRSINNEEAKLISRLIFNGIDNQSKTDLVKSSLRSYDYSLLNRKHDSEILSLTSKEDGRMNYILLANIEYIVQLHHFDLRKNDLRSFFKLISPLIERIMGVILNYEQKPVKRIFYCKLSHDKDYEKIILEPEYPQLKVPPVMQLLFCESEDLSLDKLRLQLICWLISSKLTPDIIVNLPKESVANCVTLLYLVETKQINIDEADCLLLACDCPNYIQETLKLNDMRRIKERDCRIAFLFTAVQTHIKNCFYAVGWKKFCGHITFDGLYFHHLRQKWNATFSKSVLTSIESLRIHANG